jgi:MEMO1 family protein
MSDYPRLRPNIEVRLVHDNGIENIIFFDRLRISPSPLVIPKVFGRVLGMFTGEYSKKEILDACTEQGLTPEVLDQLIKETEKALFLEGATFKKAEKSVKKEFLSKKIRPPSCAGAVYPDSPQVLASYLEKVTIHASGNAEEIEGVPLGVVIPHIDYQRGERVYAEVGKYLYSIDYVPDVVILLGTSHYGGESRYQLSRKDYEIPGAIFPNGIEVTDTIAKLYGEDEAFKDEFLHAIEHSLELPLPFLWHAWKNKISAMPHIVPILVGSFHDSFGSEGEASEIPEVSRMISILAATYRGLVEEGKKVLFVCGVDLSHVGMNFGDPVLFTEEELQLVESHDRSLIWALEDNDPQGFDLLIRETRDEHRVCGYPSLYTMSKVFEALELEPDAVLLDYMRHTESSTDTTVSFAGISFNLPF